MFDLSGLFSAVGDQQVAWGFKHLYWVTAGQNSVTVCNLIQVHRLPLVLLKIKFYCFNIINAQTVVFSIFFGKSLFAFNFCLSVSKYKILSFFSLKHTPTTSPFYMPAVSQIFSTWLILKSLGCIRQKHILKFLHSEVQSIDHRSICSVEDHFRRQSACKRSWCFFRLSIFVRSFIKIAFFWWSNFRKSNFAFLVRS